MSQLIHALQKLVSPSVETLSIGETLLVLKLSPCELEAFINQDLIQALQTSDEIVIIKASVVRLLRRKRFIKLR